MPARHAIRSLPFRPGAKPHLGVEVFRLAELFARAERGAIDHALEAPQRPEFHTLYVGLRGKGQLVVDFTPVALGAGFLTFVARGRVQQFVVDRRVDAWMLLFAPEQIGAAPDDALRAPVVRVRCCRSSRAPGLGSATRRGPDERHRPG